MIQGRLLKFGVQLLTPVIFLVAQNSMANVSLKNGNFFIGYTDLVYPGGFDPKLERVYNSKTAYKGMFGWAWGNEFEAFLTVASDASVVVHEYGGGAENRFVPVAFKPAELDQAVNNLVSVAQKTGTIASANQLADYKQRLKTDATFRNDQWEQFRSQGQIEARKLTDGTQLQSNRFSYQYITKVNDGYIRKSDSGKVEKFDNAGRLIRISDKNSNFLSLEYGKDNHLRKIVDNLNRKIFFEFNNRGLVAKIEI